MSKHASQTCSAEIHGPCIHLNDSHDCKSNTKSILILCQNWFYWKVIIHKNWFYWKVIIHFKKRFYWEVIIHKNWFYWKVIIHKN